MKLLVVFLSFVFVLNSDISKTYSVNELMGKSNPEYYQNKYELQDSAKKSFLKMQEAAFKDGIKIEVVSDFRSYEHQKRIWSRKYDRFTKDGLSPIEAINKIVEYSTIPGTSRHHWGTEIDIIDGNVKRPMGDILDEIHFEGSGAYAKLKKWMDLHSSEFGFCLVYTNDDGRKGFKYEPWHYTFEPISSNMLRQFLKIDISSILKKDNLPGSQYFTETFINDYFNNNILDINPDVKNGI